MAPQHTLTARQQRILDFIADTVRERGYPPTVREIGEVSAKLGEIIGAVQGISGRFGQVTEGMDVVNKITRRDPEQNPTFTGDVIESVTINEQ